MEEQIANIMINKSCGNSGKNSKNYWVSLPSSWIKQLGISEDNLQVTLLFCLMVNVSGFPQYA